MKLMLLLVMMVMLHAEDKPALDPRNEKIAQLQQQIQFLQRQLQLLQREKALHESAWNACQDQAEQAQQRQRPAKESQEAK